MTIALYRKAEQLMRERELLNGMIEHFAELKEQYAKQDISVSEETEEKFYIYMDELKRDIQERFRQLGTQ